MFGFIVASLIVLVLGLLTTWWANASWRGTLPRNWILGYRTKLTLSDKNAWVAVNSASAPSVLIAGVGASLAAVVGAVLATVNLEIITPVFLGGGIVWLLGWVLAGLVPARRASKRYVRSTRAR